MSLRSVFGAPLLGALALGLALPVAPAQALCTCMLRRRPPQRLPVPERPLVSDASLVAMMREGRRTVLTMRVDYQGPAEDFAMLVPVPEVLGRDQIRTLEPGVVERLDRASAPRLVEYWERNPCGATATGRLARRRAGAGLGGAAEMSDAVGADAPRPRPVRVEAEYAVDEYDITILSASDSTGLLSWLRGRDYALPDRAEPVLRSYIEQGTKFFLARVDGSRLRLDGGRGRLAPLQFHYESDAFQLPIRLGLMNSPGQQDVVVLALSHAGRVEVANRPNATVPTNLTLPADARGSFPGFYATLLDRVLARHPGAVVTELASDVDGSELSVADARALGADIVPSRNAGGFTLTRLHYRYGRDDRPDDLVFRQADPIGGGDARPTTSGDLGPLRAEGRMSNSFRARYAIFHRFEGPVSCASPERGRWGGPRPGEAPPARAADIAPASALAPQAFVSLLGDQAADLDFGFRADGKPDEPASAPPTDELGGAGAAKPEAKPLGAPSPAAPVPARTGDCACGAAAPARSAPWWAALLLGVPAAPLVWRRALRTARRRPG